MIGVLSKRKYPSSATESVCITDIGLLKSSLTCYICHGYLSTPAHQCLNGHIVCRVCYTSSEFQLKNRMCPVCLEGTCTQKCIAIDDICNSIEATCDFGCLTSTTISNMSEHEKKCNRRHVICNFGFICKTGFAFDLLLSHLRTAHHLVEQETSKERKGALVHTNRTAEFKLMGPNKNISVNLFKLTFDGKDFVFQELITARYISWSVRILDSEDCDEYISVLTIFGKKKDQTATYKIPVLSFREPRENDACSAHVTVLTAEIFLGWCTPIVEDGRVAHEWKVQVCIRKEQYYDAGGVSS